jgi:hypothetical protein
VIARQLQQQQLPAQLHRARLGCHSCCYLQCTSCNSSDGQQLLCHMTVVFRSVAYTVAAKTLGMSKFVNVAWLSYAAVLQLLLCCVYCMRMLGPDDMVCIAAAHYRLHAGPCTPVGCHCMSFPARVLQSFHMKFWHDAER